MSEKFTIREHIPGWAISEDIDNRIACTDSLEEIPWVMKWKEWPEFFRFSVSRSRSNSLNLMAELKQGKEWWVIGYLNKDIPELPDFEPK